MRRAAKEILAQELFNAYRAPFSYGHPAGKFYSSCVNRFYSPDAAKSIAALKKLFKKLRINWYEGGNGSRNALSTIFILSLRHNIETKLLSVKFKPHSDVFHLFPPGFPMKMIKVPDASYEFKIQNQSAAMMKQRLRELKYEAEWELGHENQPRKKLIVERIGRILEDASVTPDRIHEIHIHKRTVDTFALWLSGFARKWIREEGQEELTLSELMRKTGTHFQFMLNSAMYGLDAVDGESKMRLPVTFAGALAMVLEEDEFTPLFADYLGVTVLEQFLPYIGKTGEPVEKDSYEDYCLMMVRSANGMNALM